jgi:hypothetical protein
MSIFSIIWMFAYSPVFQWQVSFIKFQHFNKLIEMSIQSAFVIRLIK